MQFWQLGSSRRQIAVDMQQSFVAAHVDISVAAQQTGFGKIFVLNGTIRFAEQYEFLFFDEPCEKHVIRSEPYFSLLVAHDERYFRE